MQADVDCSSVTLTLLLAAISFDASQVRARTVVVPVQKRFLVPLDDAVADGLKKQIGDGLAGAQPPLNSLDAVAAGTQRLCRGGQIPMLLDPSERFKIPAC